MDLYRSIISFDEKRSQNGDLRGHYIQRVERRGLIKLRTLMRSNSPRGYCPKRKRRGAEEYSPSSSLFLSPEFRFFLFSYFSRQGWGPAKRKTNGKKKRTRRSEWTSLRPKQIRPKQMSRGQTLNPSPSLIFLAYVAFFAEG